MGQSSSSASSLGAESPTTPVDTWITHKPSPCALPGQYDSLSNSPVNTHCGMSISGSSTRSSNGSSGGSTGTGPRVSHRASVQYRSSKGRRNSVPEKKVHSVHIIESIPSEIYLNRRRQMSTWQDFQVSRVYMNQCWAQLHS